MSRFITLISLPLLTPLFVFAQGANTLQSSLASLLTFTNRAIIPFLLGVAFLFFVVNAIRFFVIQGQNDEGKKSARALATFGVLAFVILIIFWGVVNLFAQSTGLDGKTAPTPDYVEKRGGSFANTPSQNQSAPTAETAEVEDGFQELDVAPPETPGNPVSSFGDERDAQQRGELCPWGSEWSDADGSCQAL